MQISANTHEFASVWPTLYTGKVVHIATRAMSSAYSAASISPKLRASQHIGLSLISVNPSDLSSMT